jgi:hypothetical protein
MMTLIAQGAVAIAIITLIIIVDPILALKSRFGSFDLLFNNIFSFKKFSFTYWG